MAQLDLHRSFALFGRTFVALGCLLVSGCKESHSPVDTSGQPFVGVRYQGQPLGDVQVRLHESQGGPVIAHSISQQDGNAYFANVPSPEPSHYFVTVESISDGGWLLDAEACQMISENTSLKPLEFSKEQRIEIPDGAVRPLSFSKRR